MIPESKTSAIISQRPDQIPSQSDKPLVTFALFAYNQERFIREAVEGALAQDYEPLEIILSDDCSTDRTFAIMQEMAAGYIGPHCLILNQNEKNLGIGGHVSTILNRSQGAWVIVAAGDDVSMPSRVRCTMQVALNPKHQVDCVTVQLAEIDENSRPTGTFQNTICDASQIGATTLKGAGLAYSRRVIANFLPLNSAVCNEDIVLTARAFLLSTIGFVPIPLVLYRSHASNRPKKNRRLQDFDKKWLDFKLLGVNNTIAMVKQIERDTLGHDRTRIPDINELMILRRKAIAIGHIVMYCRPLTIQDFFLIMQNFDLLKTWLGAILANFHIAFFRKF